MSIPILIIKMLKHSRKIYDKEYEDTVNTQNEAFLSLLIRLNNQGLERHAEHYIFNWYIILYIFQDNKLLLSALLNWFQLVNGPRPARK